MIIQHMFYLFWPNGVLERRFSKILSNEILTMYTKEGSTQVRPFLGKWGFKKNILKDFCLQIPK